MSLYRKYRPLTFDDLVGQQHIEKTLRNALEQNRLAHAFLFSGPRGTGKTTTARILAKALLCEKGPSPSPDGTCGDCELVAEGRHPDVLELDAASQTGVDNVREEIISRLGYSPQRGQYKIYIIDEVHMLSTGAFNAMLKTLEEPPAHVIFILCTTNPQSVPETIRSRCQRFDFRPIPVAEIAKNLQDIVNKEGASADREALTLIARHAQGGMRDAITALEQLISYTDGKISTAEVEQSLGEISADSLYSLMSKVAERKSADVLHWVAEQIERGSDLVEVLRSLTAYMRDVYVLRIIDEPEALVDLGPDELASRQTLANAFEGSERISRILEMLKQAAADMRYSPDPRMVFELELIRMMQPEGETDLAAYAERIERLEAAVLRGFEVKSGASDCRTSRVVSGADTATDKVTELSAQEATEPKVVVDQNTPTQSSASVDSTIQPSGNAERDWREVLSYIRKNSRPSHMMAVNGAQASSDAEGTLILTWPKEQDPYYNVVQSDRSMIEEPMREVFGEVRPYRLVLGLSAEGHTKTQVVEPVYSVPPRQEQAEPVDSAPVSEPPVSEEVKEPATPITSNESVVEARPNTAPSQDSVAPAGHTKPPVEVDDDLARSLEFLGAEVAEIRDLNGSKAEDLTDESGFLADPETPPEYTQDSLF